MVDGTRYDSILKAAEAYGVHNKNGYVLFYYHLKHGKPWQGHEISFVSQSFRSVHMGEPLLKGPCVHRLGVYRG